MPAAPPPSLKIQDTMTRYRPSKSFKDTTADATITSVDFDGSGEFCIASSDDETLQLYDCQLGKHSKQLFSKKYGVHLAKFTHSPSTVIYASTKENDTIRYLSLHDNSFRRYFVGHNARVNCLEMCPINDTFISASMDNTLKLWDLNSQYYQGHLNLRAPLLAAFDPSGIIFAVASHVNSAIMLYDLRQYDKAAFATFPLTDAQYLHHTASYSGRSPAMPMWSQLEFSNDGKNILVGTVGGHHYVMDSFNGSVVARLVRDRGPTPEPPLLNPAAAGAPRTSGDVCWSPDGRFIIGGAGDKSVCVWDMLKEPAEGNLRPMVEMEYPKDSATCVAFNPRKSLFVTARKEVVFWLPDLGDEYDV